MSVDNAKIYVDSLSDSSDEYSFSGSDGTVKHGYCHYSTKLVKTNN